MCICGPEKHNLIDFAGPKLNALVYVCRMKNAMYFNFFNSTAAHLLVSCTIKKGFVIHMMASQANYMLIEMKL